MKEIIINGPHVIVYKYTKSGASLGWRWYNTWDEFFAEEKYTESNPVFGLYTARKEFFERWEQK